MKKSDAMAAILAEDRDIKPADAVELAKSKGVEITTQSFSVFKSAWKKKQGEASPSKKKTEKESFDFPSPPTAGNVSLAELKKVKELIGEIGADRLEELVKILK